MSIEFFNISFTKSKINNLFIFRFGKYLTITNL